LALPAGFFYSGHQINSNYYDKKEMPTIVFTITGNFYRTSRFLINEALLSKLYAGTAARASKLRKASAGTPVEVSKLEINLQELGDIFQFDYPVERQNCLKRKYRCGIHVFANPYVREFLRT
jgi:hypothetical protein